MESEINAAWIALLSSTITVLISGSVSVWIFRAKSRRDKNMVEATIAEKTAECLDIVIENLREDLERIKSDFEGREKALNEKIKSLNEHIKTLKSDNKTLRSLVNTLTERISILQEENKTFLADIKRLNRETGELKGNNSV